MRQTCELWNTFRSRNWPEKNNTKFNIATSILSVISGHQGDSICSSLKLLTRRAAQTILYNLSGYQGLQSPVYPAMIGLIQRGTLDAYTVIPALITPFWVGGARDSDMNEEKYTEDQTEKRVLGSENLRKSARLALADLIKN